MSKKTVDIESNNNISLFGGDYAIFGPIENAELVVPLIAWQYILVSEYVENYLGITPVASHPRKETIEMKAKVKTSVIGSYPICIDALELINAYFSQRNSSWTKYIEQAVHDMMTAGIDYVSDGQTGDPLIQLFTRKLGGCRVRDRTEIIGDVEYDGPITLQDQKYTKQILPKNIGLVGVLTGPYTLTRSSVDFFIMMKNNETRAMFRAFSTASSIFPSSRVLALKLPIFLFVITLIATPPVLVATFLMNLRVSKSCESVVHEKRCNLRLTRSPFQCGFHGFLGDFKKLFCRHFTCPP